MNKPTTLRQRVTTATASSRFQLYRIHGGKTVAVDSSRKQSRTCYLADNWTHKGKLTSSVVMYTPIQISRVSAIGSYILTKRTKPKFYSSLLFYHVDFYHSSQWTFEPSLSFYQSAKSSSCLFREEKQKVTSTPTILFAYMHILVKPDKMCRQADSPYFVNWLVGSLSYKCSIRMWRLRSVLNFVSLWSRGSV